MKMIMVLRHAGPFVKLYYSSQFTPLIVFFLLFLAVVKNTKMPHFVRFNCMQGIMLDIVVMLFNILRGYFPAEFRWSAVLSVLSLPHFYTLCPQRAMVLRSRAGC